MSARLCACLIAAVAACTSRPVTRDCHSDADCSSSDYCVFTPALCGAGKHPGTCRSRPTSCDDAYRPVCGCDREVHPSACAAATAGVDLAVNGRCAGPGPRDWIACGAQFCDAHTSYCEIVLSDVVDPPTDYACRPLPAACVPVDGIARDCACFPPGTRCLSFCGLIQSGGLAGFHLTCRL